jgi:HK97 family phage prohead protease
MNRAYSLLTVKRVSEDERLIEGIASTPEPDRMGDVVEPKGAQFKLPLPLLMHHDSRQPVGHVLSAKVTNDGIDVTARIIKFDEPGRLKERLDEAWHTVKSGLINGLSIGFRAIERSYIEDTSSIRFTAWEWLELSIVSVPANSEASITTVRSLCDRAASGPPAPSGAPEIKPIKPVILRPATRLHPIRVNLPGQKEA